ncbi:MAG: DUF4313 domain-containing protein [Rikenellaceae bacterium]|nr:DUF4313 domain-containing protein [Rikenellaceae bacterium]
MSIKLERYGHVYDITFELDRYASGGGLAILMEANSRLGPMPYAVLTVNLEDYPTYGNRAYVDVNNLGDEILAWIEENNLGVPTGEIGYSGFCVYPEYSFNLDEINKHT